LATPASSTVRRQRGQDLRARHIVTPEGGHCAPRLIQPFSREPLRAIQGLGGCRVAGALKEEQPRALELNGQGGQRVGEHVVDLACQAGALLDLC